MIEKIRNVWQENPLSVLLLIGLAIRLLSAIFSKGYGMHDDHFLVIEKAQSVINDYSIWKNRSEITLQSIIYPGIHYYLLSFIQLLGINDPQSKMLVIRIIHALYSLLIISFGYKITEIISDRKTAIKAGLLLALLWPMPFMSVRNLVEMVCIPPMLAGFYLILKRRSNMRFFSAGLLFGISFLFRVQTALIPAGIGLALILEEGLRLWRPLPDGTQTNGTNSKSNAIMERLKLGLILGAGFVASVVIIQGIVDWLAWGYPLASFMEYFKYNYTHYMDYTTGPWYQYILLLIGLFIPPISIFLLFGYLYTWRRNMILFLPVLLFLVFHSIYPNKQERFILPVVPLLVVLCLTGWEEFLGHSAKWKSRTKTLKTMWIIFWFFNTIMLIVFSFNYGKRARVEALTYLSHKQDLQGIVIDGGKFKYEAVPKYYIGKQCNVYFVNKSEETDSLKKIFRSGGLLPNYALFYGDEELGKRKIMFQGNFGRNLVYQTTISQSLADWVFYKLNPAGNKNLAAYVYRIE